MEYKIVIFMNELLDEGRFDNAEERFLSAVNCAKGAVESILYDYSAQINSQENFITIKFEQSTVMNKQKLEQILKSAFCKESGEIYPEFQRVCIEEK